MGKTKIKAITDSIFNETLDTLLRPETPVDDSVAEKVAAQVTRDIAPIAVNAANAEPWYRSRVILGLIGTGLGLALNKLGIALSDGDMQVLLANLGTIIEAGGALFALYGRIRSGLKPLGQ